MKKVLFAILILAVLGVVGFYCWTEFSVPEITFVADKTTISTKGNEMAVRRLYTSGADYEELNQELTDSLISTEFTEDEIYAAAIASGLPEFYPAFYVSVTESGKGDNTYIVTGKVRQELADNQTRASFKIGNLRLEAIAEGVAFNEAKTNIIDKTIVAYSEPIIASDGSSLTIDLNNVYDYTLGLGGSAGRVTLQFTYDILSSGIFSGLVMEDQLIIIDLDVSPGEEGKMNVAFNVEPYAAIDELE